MMPFASLMMCLVPLVVLGLVALSAVGAVLLLGRLKR
jgi:hypothetical protein